MYQYVALAAGHDQLWVDPSRTCPCVLTKLIRLDVIAVLYVRLIACEYVN